MHASSPSRHVLRFGVFEANIVSGELRKHGIRIKLQEQPFQILALLLERPGEVVTREELQQKLWQGETFVDFDVGLNTAVKKLRDALGDSADSPQFVETLPRRGYRFIASVEQGAEPSPIREIESLAVFPLENLTGDPAQDYFVDGMTDALITRLAQISSLRVISRTSVMHYKQGKKLLPEIARELNVDAVVEGTVTRSGKRVRITAQLIHAASDYHMWAEKYERDLRDILLLQSEVARAIVAEIQVRVTPHEEARLTRAGPVHPEAYDAYLKGRFYWNKRTEEAMNKSLGYFQQSIAADPGSALGQAGLADAYNMFGFWGLLPPRDSYSAAKSAAVAALQTDGTLAEACAALGWVRFAYDWDWAGGERDLQRAIELNPRYATAHQWYSHLLIYVGRRQEALGEVQRTLELEPVSLVMNSSGALIHLFARDYEKTLEQAYKTVDLDPHFPPPHLWIGWAYAKKRMYPKAVAELEKALALVGFNPRYLATLGYCYADSGNSVAARKVLSELEQLSVKRYISPYEFAAVHAGLNEKEQALTWLERAFEERSSWLTLLRVDSRLDGLHEDPRFRNLAQRIGLSI